jgi:hypothetical protein
MAVGADQSIGVRDRLAVLVLAGPDALRDILQVDLVAGSTVAP